MIDIHFREFMKDDVATAASVIEFAGQPVTRGRRAAIRAFMDANPRGKHGTIDYRLEDVGLDAGRAPRGAALLPGTLRGCRKNERRGGVAAGAAARGAREHAHRLDRHRRDGRVDVRAPACAPGFRATVFTRTRAKAEPLLAAGAAWADTPRAVAEASDVVFTMVGFPPTCARCVLGPSGRARRRCARAASSST